jgi:hypothetical protein
VDASTLTSEHANPEEGRIEAANSSNNLNLADTPSIPSCPRDFPIRFSNLQDNGKLSRRKTIAACRKIGSAVSFLANQSASEKPPCRQPKLA